MEIVLISLQPNVLKIHSVHTQIISNALTDCAFQILENVSKHLILQRLLLAQLFLKVLFLEFLVQMVDVFWIRMNADQHKHVKMEKLYAMMEFADLKLILTVAQLKAFIHIVLDSGVRMEPVHHPKVIVWMKVKNVLEILMIAMVYAKHLRLAVTQTTLFAKFHQSFTALHQLLIVLLLVRLACFLLKLRFR